MFCSAPMLVATLATHQALRTLSIRKPPSGMPLILKELAQELLDLLNISFVGPLAFLHRLFEFLDVVGAAVLAHTPSLNHHLLVLLRFIPKAACVG